MSVNTRARKFAIFLLLLVLVISSLPISSLKSAAAGTISIQKVGFNKPELTAQGDSSSTISSTGNPGATPPSIPQPTPTPAPTPPTYQCPSGCVCMTEYEAEQSPLWWQKCSNTPCSQRMYDVPNRYCWRQVAPPSPQPTPTPTPTPTPRGCLGAWDVWGLSGVGSNYDPGASISGSLSYKISNNSDSPGAMGQILVGIVDSNGRTYGVTCLYDGNPRTCPDYTSGTGRFNLTTPNSPGSYTLIAAMDRNYSCSSARSNFPSQGGKETLATFAVSGADSGPSDCYWSTSSAITTNVIPSGSGYINVSPDRVQMPSLCCNSRIQASCTMVTTLTLTANPASGWIFDHWEDDAYGANSTAQVSIGGSGRSHANVTAVFKQRYIPPPTCSGTWDVWGLSGVGSNYDPGASVSGNLSYKISNNSDSPGAMGQILVGIVDSNGRTYGVTCLYDGNPRTCPDYTSGTGRFNLTAPNSPGSYTLIAAMDRNYSCSSARSNFPSQGGKETLSTFVVGSPDVKKSYTLIIEVIGEGTTEPKAGIYKYESGTAVTFTANPATGWVLRPLEGDPGVYGKTSPLYITMNEDLRIIVRFEKSDMKKTYTITISTVGDGDTNPSSGTYTYDKGDSVTITASPNSGYVFDHWGGDASGKSSSTTITMDSDKSVAAYFNQPIMKQFTLTISTVGDGDTNPSSGTYTYNDGDRVTITASPSSGSLFDHWGGDASGSSISTTITMDFSKSVIAYFAKDGTGTNKKGLTIKPPYDSSSQNKAKTVESGGFPYMCDAVALVDKDKGYGEIGSSAALMGGSASAMSYFTLLSNFESPETEDYRIKWNVSVKGKAALLHWKALMSDAFSRGETRVECLILDRSTGQILSTKEITVFSAQAPESLNNDFKDAVSVSVLKNLAKLALSEANPLFGTAIELSVTAWQLNNATKLSPIPFNQDIDEDYVIETGPIPLVSSTPYSLVLLVYNSSIARSLGISTGGALSAFQFNLNSIDVISSE